MDAHVINTKQLSVLLNVPVTTLGMWRKKSYGPAWYKVTDTPTCPVVYRLSDVQRWISDNKWTSESRRKPGRPPRNLV